MCDLKLKCSLGKYNKNLAFHHLNKAEEFLAGLYLEGGELVINSRQRIGFISLMLNGRAVKLNFINLLLFPEV